MKSGLSHLDDLLAKYPNLNSKVKRLSKELQEAFARDFGNASEDVIKQLNKENSEMLNAWKNFRSRNKNKIICN